MSLNLKNERTVALVRELARRTGRSQTSAVEAAVAAQLAALDEASGAEAAAAAGDARRAQSSRLLADIHRSLSDRDRTEIRRAESDLYDEAGLPR